MFVYIPLHICVFVYIYIYIYCCVYMFVSVKTGNKSDDMKMYKYKKIKGLSRKILLSNNFPTLNVEFIFLNLH